MVSLLQTQNDNFYTNKVQHYHLFWNEILSGIMIGCNEPFRL